MNKLLLAAVAASLAAFGAPAMADMNLAKAKNCTACHALDKKVIGPNFKEIAAKYASDKGAVARLVGKVRQGGSGTWGQIPMPANPQVSAAEAETLVKWIMSQR